MDKLVLSHENPHEMPTVENMLEAPIKNQKLMKMGKVTAIAATIHNFSEGIAIFMSILKNPSLGIVIALSIAIQTLTKKMPFPFLFIKPPEIRKKHFIFLFYRDW